MTDAGVLRDLGLLGRQEEITPNSLPLKLIATVRNDVTNQLADLTPILKANSDERDVPAEAARAEPIIWASIDELIHRLSSAESPLTTEVEHILFERVKAEIFGLGGFETYLFDPSVENVFVNGYDNVFVSKSGGDGPERKPPIVESDQALIALINQWASRLGRTERSFDVANPRLDLRLPGGFRLHAIMEVANRPTVTIRCPYSQRVTLTAISRRKTIDQPLQAFLVAAVKARLNIIVAGGTGTGKTTLLKALLSEVPPTERIITVEDTAELGLASYPDHHPNVVELETRDDNAEGIGSITMLELTRECLRMSPDRVVLGEVRGAEALYMLKAMGQGNDGSMCTIHSESARGVSDRIRGYVAEGASGLATEVVDGFFRSAVDLVIHLKVTPDKRRVVNTIVEVQRDRESGVRYNDLFVSDGDNVAESRSLPSPRIRQRLESAGLREAEIW